MPARTEPVADVGDPRLAAYASLRERDLVGREGRFVAEGLVVMRVLARESRFAVESVLVAQGREGAIAPLFDDRAEDVPLYAAPQAVLDGLTGFHVHRGILAIARRVATPSAPALLASIDDPHAVIAVCLGVSNHDNVGGIFRNAAAFGAAGVLLDAASCDPLYRKSIRVSVGGALVVPFAHGGSEDEVLAAVEAAGYEAVALSPRGEEEIGDVTPRGRMALLLGAEGPGLREAVIARVRSARIAMAPGFDSLNVAASAGVALHAITRARLLAAGR